MLMALSVAPAQSQTQSPQAQQQSSTPEYSLPHISYPKRLYYREHPEEFQQMLENLPRVSHELAPGNRLPQGQAPTAGSWFTLTHLPGVNLMNPILLTDGTVIAYQSCTGNWYKLTPAAVDNYIDGTWTQIASLPAGYAPRFFGSGVLPDGRVIVEGGEYNGSTACTNAVANDTTLGAIYDPVANTWTAVSPPNGWASIGDGGGIVLPNGTYMQTQCCIAGGYAALLNPSNLTWTRTDPSFTQKFDAFEEESLALMQNDKVLTVNTYTDQTYCANGSEIFDPATLLWSNSSGSTLTPQADCSNLKTFEIGPLVARPDGKVVSFPGLTTGVGRTSIYDPTTNQWTPSAIMPVVGGLAYTMADAPAAVLPNGNILAAMSPGNWAANNSFSRPTHYFELNIADNTFTQVGDKSDSASTNSFQISFLVLPTGQIMAFNADGPAIEVYIPAGSPDPSWAPVITSVPANIVAGSSITLSGTQLNGLSEGAYYGDDANASTNYPIVMFQHINTLHRYYARTINPSTRSIAPGRASSVTVQVPAGADLGNSNIYVIANGIASAPVGVNIIDRVGGTTTTLNSNHNPSVYAQTVNFAATVATSDNGFPQGTVTFSDGNSAIGSAALRSGQPVAGGGYHTCALTAAGGVKCWGLGSTGALGHGDLAGQTTPVDVSGLTSGVTAIAAGQIDTCAVTVAGGVKCWGKSFSGELGNGVSGTYVTDVPVDVVGLNSGVVAITASYTHTCALTSAGTVKCWGDNSYGELGDGTTTQRNTPVDVSGLGSGVVAIAAGPYFTCAVTSAGGVKCWGANQYGQLGNGTTTPNAVPNPIPVDVIGLASGVAAVSLGAIHSCALTTAGGLKCWGYNGYGQVGDGTTTDRHTPVDVSGLTSGVVAVSLGRLHSCVVTIGAGAECWGYNGNGQLGNGNTTDQHTPVNVHGLDVGLAGIALGEVHSCALTTGAALKCWGWGQYGQIGDGTNSDHNIPTTVTGFGFNQGLFVASATLGTASLAAGSHPITAAHGGDGSHGASTSSILTQVVNQGATTTAVVSSANPSNIGQTVQFTATVTPTAGGTPSGTVTFKDGATTLGTGSLSGGVATLSTSALSAGTHAITAAYGGDTNFAGSTSPGLTQTVNVVTSTSTTSIGSSANPSVFGQSVTFTATVTAGATGTVIFKDGGTTIGSGYLSGETATYFTSALTVGGHTITAVYDGDGSFTGSTSSGLTQTVNQGATTTALVSSANPSAVGQSVTFTATITPTSPASGTPNGSVTFKNGAATLGTGTLTDGVASYSTATLTAGTYSITAVYGADSNFTGSTSPVLTQSVIEFSTSRKHRHRI